MTLFRKSATWLITLMRSQLQVIYLQFTLTYCNRVFLEAPIISNHKIKPHNLPINHEAE